ncbi:MAG: hypothetical protein RM338_03820 [Nostoc sp. DedQUE12a]|nr:hypothetical protein [Nostoc sp. DedQUE12a]
MVAAQMATTSAQQTQEINTATKSRSQPKSYFKICYDPLAVFLKSSDKAMFVQHLHFWHENEYSGYLIKDGRKWIMNGYEEWSDNFPWLTPRKIGNIVRYLEQIGWVITKRFYDLKRNVGFVHKCPSLHEDNQRKWYCLNYQKIYEDTGFDLLFGQQDGEPTSPPSRRQRSPKANIPKQDVAIYQNKMLQSTETAQSSYIENPKNSHTNLEENFEKNKEDSQEKYQDGITGSCTESLGQTETLHLTKKITHGGQYSAAPRNKNSQKNLEWDWLPNGPWRTESGKLDDNFLNAVAENWVKKYGGTLTDKRKNVIKHFRNDPTNLPIEWQWYQDTFIHRVANIQVRQSGGMATATDKKMIVKNIRAALPLPEEMRVTETKSPEQVVEEIAPYALPTIQAVKNTIASAVDVPAVLPSAKETEFPQLEPQQEVDWDAVEIKTQQFERQQASIPEDGENSEAYAVYNISQSDRDYWRSVAHSSSAQPKLQAEPKESKLDEEVKESPNSESSVPPVPKPHPWSQEGIAARSKARPLRMNKLKMAGVSGQNPGFEFLQECWDDDPSLQILVKKLLAKFPQWKIVCIDGKLIDWEESRIEPPNDRGAEHYANSEVDPSLKTQEQNTGDDTPPIDNLVDAASEPNPSLRVDAHEWKQHDRAIYCGEEVSLQRVSADDNSVLIRHQNGDLEEVQKLLLFKPESGDRR